MPVKSLICPACSAPITAPVTAARLACPYCKTHLLVDAAGQAAASAATQEELRRLQLRQELTAAQLQLTQVQGEERALQRLPVTAVTRRQMQEVAAQKAQLTAQVRHLTAQLDPSAATPVPWHAPEAQGRPWDNLLDLLVNPNGRIGRSQFWLGMGMVMVGLLLVGPWVGMATVAADEAGASNPLGIVLLPLLWCGFAVASKRYHDLDKARWWVAVTLIPVIGPLWALYELGVRPGTPGPNRYGWPGEPGRGQ